MAFTDHAGAALAAPQPRLRARIAALFQRIAEANPHLSRVRRLQALTDAQLEALGLRRRDIVHTVFQPVYYR